MTQAEVIMRSAEMRLDRAIEEFKRQAMGDEAYHQEAKHVRVMDVYTARNDPPPEPGVRKRLIPIGVWIQRMRGR